MREYAGELASFLDDLPTHLSDRTWIRSSGVPRRPPKRVLYWTHHALRSDENPALDVALHVAHHLQLPLLVYQGLSERYRYASDRHHTFILEAARDLQESYAKLGISFAFHLERRGARFPRLAQLALSSAVVVTEDFPLEATQQWTERLVAADSTVVLVDTACVVPTRLVGKAHDRAFTFRDATRELYRSRISQVWPASNISVPRDSQIPFESLQLANLSLAKLVSECEIDHSIGPVPDTRGGFSAGYARWQAFRNEGLRRYTMRRNQIEVDGVSRMSAYLHYGMVSPLRLAREASLDGAKKFLDELLIWRELAYAFCYYRDDLESVHSLPQWANASLTEHAGDHRTVLSLESLARARSGERLWDAAQRSLLKHGELHNNIRMTWGKAILGWSQNHHQALERLIDLNHRYALDGRDPASYGGILWCLGQFDRPFKPEQPVFGMVRGRPIGVHENRVDLNIYETKVDRGIMTPKPRIAMVGAGLGGLMCSRILQDHGLDIQIFEKSGRAGGRASTRVSRDGWQFDHGAQYFAIRDPNLKRYLDSWIFDKHVAEWRSQIVSIDEPCEFKELPQIQRFVGTPMMESLAFHLATDLDIHAKTEVARVVRRESGYQLCTKVGHDLGIFDTVLWNCPPGQTAEQIPTECGWQRRLPQVDMQPCWAVMIALERRWTLPFDAAFVNLGNLSWIARDSSKPARPSRQDTWMLHSTSDWAMENQETPREQVVHNLIAEAERVTGFRMPAQCYAKAHRWLHSRPADSLPESSLWDSANRLGACGDWCGGPRVEGALKSGMALAGRILGTLHENASLAS
ncbi:FAD-dependent oxidoreductase [Aureliella helgolandensis]|uniref:Deoxyribodipyrimidine photo-lyase n=1 Tax=Aureliella helgolandensis TaxID=2527968 RepID=A0A518GCV8_9BACT|nr:FAD-dependent oxidoreductase [Aureliella helgolandensis]QDV26432.1 Deoxyribodipyrimidine photo-lyase [Aureliella helgolandensis]